jgi:hypothetical protein
MAYGSALHTFDLRRLKMKRLFTAFAVCAALASGAAQAQSACNWGSLRSDGTNQGRLLTVVNAVPDRTANLYWIDFDGNPIFYAAIPPNGQHVQETLYRHVWVVENSYGYCDVIFRVENNLDIVIR